MENTLIHIEWKGPYPLEKVINEMTNKKNDQGLYQIYGYHPVYGKNVLLYIGQTCENTFSGRMKEHAADWLNPNELESSYIYVRIGNIPNRKEMDPQTWKQLIDDAETLLIYSHWPTANTMMKNKIDDKKYYNTHILNWGEFGDLLPEISGDRWTDKHDEIFS